MVWRGSLIAKYANIVIVLETLCCPKEAQTIATIKTVYEDEDNLLYYSQRLLRSSKNVNDT